MTEVTTTADLFGGTELSPVRNPYPVYRRLRHEHPVIPMEMIGGVGYLITRYDDVLDLLKNDALYSNRCNANGIGRVMGRTIVEMDGREHLRHRSLITPYLAPRALRGDFPKLVESIAHELIDRFADEGRADLVPAFTFSFPLRVFTRILGLSVEDYDLIHNWGIDLTSFVHDPERGFGAAAALADYLRPVLEKRRAEPTGDLISNLAHAQVDGNRLTDEEVVSFLRLLVIAGAETTYHLTGSALLALLTDPDQLEEVRADRSKMQAVVDEALRWESPVQLVTRQATQPVTIAGVEIPADAELLVAIGSANRDESRFEDPDRFDIHRGPIEHLAFGLGKHYCAGSRLAYLEAKIALNALLDRLPNLHLDASQACGVVGLAFRGPDRLPVFFDVT